MVYSSNIDPKMLTLMSMTLKQTSNPFEDGLCMNVKLKLGALSVSLKLNVILIHLHGWMCPYMKDFHMGECHFFMDECHLWVGLNK